MSARKTPTVTPCVFVHNPDLGVDIHGHRYCRCGRAEDIAAHRAGAELVREQAEQDARRAP